MVNRRLPVASHEPFAGHSPTVCPPPRCRLVLCESSPGWCDDTPPPPPRPVRTRKSTGHPSVGPVGGGGAYRRVFTAFCFFSGPSTGIFASLLTERYLWSWVCHQKCNESAMLQIADTQLPSKFTQWIQDKSLHKSIVGCDPQTVSHPKVEARLRSQLW